MQWLAGGINRILGWLASVASDRDGSPSSKRLMYIYIIGLVGGGIVGLTTTLMWVATQVLTGQDAVAGARIVADTLVWVVGSALASVTGGYIGGKAVERKGAPADAPAS